MHSERREEHGKNIAQKSHFTKTLQLADQEDPSIGFPSDCCHSYLPAAWHFTLRHLGQLGCRKSQGKDWRSMLHVCLHALLEEHIGTMILPDGIEQGHLLAEMQERGVS